MNMIYMILQMFAEAGNVVNTTTGTVNAYTGAATTTEAMAPELKTYYDTELLENARVEMYYAQFGKRQPLPRGNGKTVEWRKFNTFAKADKLKEAVIPDGQTFGVSIKTGSINQYGTYTAISDQLELHAYDPMILGATEEMGASAAETQETLIRDSLLKNTNVMYAGDKTGAAELTDGDILTPDLIAKAVTKLKKDKAPRINGKYVAVVHPSVAYDLRKSEEWIEAHKYSATTEIFNGEIGELHGCRFIESPFAPVLGGDYISGVGVTYATFMFGKDAFGIIDPEGGALQMIVKDKSQVGGPLNQFSTIGYKLETNGSTILYPERMITLFTVSSFSGTDAVNYDPNYTA